MSTTPMKAGRPRANKTKRRYFEGQLYPLLFNAMPHHITNNRLDVSSLAAALGNSRMALYRRMEEDRLTTKAAQALVEESKGRLKLEALIPFILA